MTVEEIKSEIDRHIDKCNVNGFGLTSSILSYIKRLLDDLETSWHPYPAEKPEENGYYQVTFDDSTVDLAGWKDGSWVFNPKIIAWKEKDKPYKKREK